MHKRAIGTLVIAAGLLAAAVPAVAQAPAKAPAAPAQKTEAKETDPVCGMKVDPKTSPSATYKGKKYYFCSASEKTEFEKSPEKYLNKKK